MEWTSLDTWIVVTGMLSATACALLGTYLVLRRMSMMGDAISHAVLPGLAVAFLIAGNRDSITMLIGATAIGVLTSLLIQGVSRLSGLDRGASMGVIFTTLFALGLILIRQAADHVDLDPGCVLYGAIELSPLDVYELFGFEIPRAAVTSGAMLLINAVFVLAFYKELKITSFDPALATTIGINADAVHYALMTLVAATTIAAFESVGSILVIAMLIVPGAAAHLLTDRLSLMLVLSLVIACLSAALGHVGAITIPAWFGFRDTSTAGMMAVSVGFVFVLIFLFAPRYGVTSRMLNQILLTLQITRDDILGLLYRFRELAPADTPAIQMQDLREALKTGVAVRIAIFNLLKRNLIRRTGDGFSLTDSGLAAGTRLIRSHRLWESYLCHKMGFCPEDVHYTAHRLEHFTDERMRVRLEEEAGRPEESPHHRKIPE